MSIITSIEQQKLETRAIIDELLNDGSDPDAIYCIEHHFSSEDEDALEKFAVEAFKLGYEVADPEELEVEDDDILCCDVISELPLDANLIDQQVEQLFTLSQQFGVNYDGWGTYFEGESDEEDEALYEDDEEEDNEDSEPSLFH